MSTEGSTAGEKAYRNGVKALCQKHAALCNIVERHGIPEFWHRTPGFAGMVNIIVSQQLSSKAAMSINKKFETFLGEVTTENVLKHDVAALNAAGLTRQKAGYCIGLARLIEQGTFDFSALESMSDEDARETLITIKGVGRWTADIYLMFAMQRNNIWPLGDLALARAMEEVLVMDHTPDIEEQNELARQWHPWRGCAARLLWSHYVNRGS